MRVIKLGDDNPISRAEFTDTAQTEWKAAKAAYFDVHRKVDDLFELLHKPGDVRVLGRVTGAAYAAKELRKDVDKLIEALDEIVRAGKRVES